MFATPAIAIGLRCALRHLQARETFYALDIGTLSSDEAAGMVSDFANSFDRCFRRGGCAMRPSSNLQRLGVEVHRARGPDRLDRYND